MNADMKNRQYNYQAVFLSAILFLFSGHVQGESLTWLDCVGEALKNNPDLVSASESVRQSEASVAANRSKMFPSLSGSLSGERSGGDESDMSDSFAYGVSARQLLYDGGKSLSDTRSSSERLSASRFRYDVTSAGVRLSLRSAFVDLLKAQRQVTIAEDILSRRKQSTKLIRLSYEGGREHRGSLMTAEAKEAQAEFDLAQARRNVEMAQSKLRELLGRPALSGMDDLAVKGRFEPSVQEKDKPDFVKLAESTPLVNELISQSNAARLGVKSSKADFYPSVYASAGASRSASDWPPEKDQWNAGVSMSLPIFEGGSRVADVSRAKSVARQAESDEKGGRLSASAVLREKWIRMQNAIEKISVREKFLDASRERARISEVQYSSGLLGFDSWIIIEDDFVLAEQSFLDAQAGALTAEAEWVNAKGGTLENESK